jgi:hypothetical protein
VADECLTCAAGEGRIQLSLVPSLAVTEHWRVEQAYPIRSAAGWSSSGAIREELSRRLGGSVRA